MFFLILSLGFKIHSPHHKKNIKDEFNCVNGADIDFVKDGSSYWQWSSEFLCRCTDVHIIRSRFGKFRLYGREQNSLMWCWDSFYAESCEFFEIEYVKILLCIQGETGNGIIKNCQFRDVGNENVDTHTIFSELRHNEFSGNKFTFNQRKSGRIFDLWYHSGTKFINNVIENAWCGKDTSVALFVNDQDAADDLIIKDCIFKNCTGNNPSMLRIENLCYDLTLQNITFENCKNKGSSECYFSSFTAYSNRGKNTFNLKFKDCKFIDLVSKSVGGGGIGMFYTYQNAGSNNFLYLNFENTRFEHISNTEQTAGGGAISISPSSIITNKNTHLIVTNCVFNDVKSSGKGGAIYYDTDNCNININGCKFTDASATSGSHSLYIKKDNTEKVTVSNCQFTNCGSQEGTFSINLDVYKFEFLYNKITFTNPERSCGCITANANRISEHIYRGNLFHNAKNYRYYDTVGINEPGSSSYAVLTIENNTFDSINSPSQGKCIVASFLSDSGLTIKNNTFTNCKGGGFYIKIMFTNQVDSFKINACKFIGNEIGESWNSEFGHCPQFWIQNKEINPYTYKMTLNFEDCFFERNKSPKMGGAVNYGKNRYISNTDIHFSRCQFVENSATEGGGALALITYQGCHIENCIFRKNYADHGNGAIYIETDFHDKENPNSYPSNRNPRVEIVSCNFIENGDDKSNNEITFNSSPNAPVSITSCSFSNSKINNFVIEIPSNVQSTLIQKCKIEFTNNDGRGGISIGSSGKVAIEETQFLSTSKKSALAISSSDSSNEVSITKSTFDSCNANEYSCFNLAISTHLFTFAHNVVSKSVLSGYNNYIGNMVFNTNDVTFQMNNITFINNACSSLYGGGVGLRLINIDKMLHLYECKFINNEARQDTSCARPYQTKKGIYYNGDGGGIQLGYHCLMNKMAVKFEKCTFSNNKAQRHGGAIALQTLNTVEIIGCTFENNIANYNFESSNSELLVENHFDKKTEGRGGAIYINPIYTYQDPKAQCDDPTASMVSVLIKDSTLKSNSAYDGYGMYVESDDNPGTTFSFNNINFFDNYNLSNHDSDPLALYGAVITTELDSITESDFNTCHFSYLIDNLDVKKVSHVDHYGKTPTKQFTESDYFPSNGFSQSSSFSVSDYFTKSNDFTSSNKFVKTSEFSHSHSFTKSKEFTESNAFTKSDNFKPTSAFTKSNDFKQTSPFTKSDVFKPSKTFSSSFYFTESARFSSSNAFSDKEKETITISSEISEATFSISDSSSFSEDSEMPSFSLDSSPTNEESETTSSSFNSSPTNEESETISSILESSSFNDDSETSSSNSDSVTKSEEQGSSITNSDYSSASEKIYTSSSEIYSDSSSFNDENKETIVSSKSSSINEDPVFSSSYSENVEGDKPISTKDVGSKASNSDLANIKSETISQSDNVNNEPNSMSKRTKKSKLPVILGIVIGIVALIIIVIVVLIIVLRKRRSTSDFEDLNHEMAFESNINNDSDSQDFNNPLFNPSLTAPDPFEEQFDEDLI